MLTRAPITALVLIHVGCAHAPTAPTTPCGRPIGNVEELAAPGRTLILGEMHGTRELPEAAGAIACDASRRGPVVLGLELPVEALSQPGQSAYWREAFPDGRSSEAMAALVERVATWRREGRPLEVLAFDGNETATESRDTVMAATIARRRAERPDATFVLLMGNLHARKQVGSPWKPDDGHRWLATQLRFPVTALNVAAPAGTMWVCTGAARESCGARSWNASKGAQASNSVRLENSAVFDGVLDLASLTASPPAQGKPTDFDEVLAELKAEQLAIAAYDRNDFDGCAELLSKARRFGPQYTRSCCLARAGKADAAFESLNTAVTAGFSDGKSLEVDEDLLVLHPDPRWKKLVGRLSP